MPPSGMADEGIGAEGLCSSDGFSLLGEDSSEAESDCIGGAEDIVCYFNGLEADERGMLSIRKSCCWCKKIEDIV